MHTFAHKRDPAQKSKSQSSARAARAFHQQIREASSIPKLQRTIGNQAVQRLLYKQEADRISQQMMLMPEPQLQRACACGGGCLKCQTEQVGQEQERLQTKRVRSSDLTQTPVPPIVREALYSPGQPLATTTRAFFEPRFGHDFSQVRVHADVPQTTRAKLIVGQPGDVYEQEADEVATTVMQMPDPQAVEGHVPTAMQAPATRHNWVLGKDEVRRQPGDLIFEVPEEEGMLQTKAVSGHTPELAPSFEGQLKALEGRGQPFPPSVRAFFEPRFGYDFSPVRVHTHAWAHQMARAVNARAFTLGRHIVFGERNYAPTTSEGQHLLAHELTHMIQQGAVTQGSASSNPLSTAPRTGSEVPSPSVRAPSTTQFMLQKADCNFYVYDSTEATKLGTAWKLAAIGLAMKAHGGYYVASGDSIEEMLHRVLSGYAEKDCDCIEEIQFLSHGSSGNAMYISKTGDELTINDFNIPELEKYGDGPTNTPGYRAWHGKLTPRQRRLVLLRRILCGPGAEVYYRSCQAFQGKAGQEFAKASAAFWRSKVIGHTKVIALTQPGKKVLKPGQEPDWPESEGTGAPSPKKPVGVGAEQKPKKD